MQKKTEDCLNVGNGEALVLFHRDLKTVTPDQDIHLAWAFLAGSETPEFLEPRVERFMPFESVFSEATSRLSEITIRALKNEKTWSAHRLKAAYRRE